MTKVNVKTIDFKKLEKAFTEMDNEKGEAGLSILEEMKFQKKTLSKMREDIENSSLIAEYSNYKRSNPVIAGYNAMINNYSKLVKQAIELLPNENQTEVNVDDLLNEEY
ncbi:MAG: hypothetical protein IKD74_03540 [Clostridia bacterium]|nr:hypothetical protein [Clostridia bacterium]